jgi:hypothetical protein
MSAVKRLWDDLNLATEHILSSVTVRTADLRELLAHIDGEPARLAAAREAAVMEWRAGAADRDELRADCERQIAAAREEQREACEVRLREHSADIMSDRVDGAHRRIAELESPVPGLAESGPYSLADVTAIEAHRGKEYARLRATVAERDAAQAEAAALLDFLRTEESFAWFHGEGMVGGTKEWRSARQENAETIKAFLAKTGRAAALLAERDAMRAQVTAARRVCLCDSSTTARDVLIAMDEAKP